jgi:hypothetical protein
VAGLGLRGQLVEALSLDMIGLLFVDDDDAFEKRKESSMFLVHSRVACREEHGHPRYVSCTATYSSEM